MAPCRAYLCTVNFAMSASATSAMNGSHTSAEFRLARSSARSSSASRNFLDRVVQAVVELDDVSAPISERASLRA